MPQAQDELAARAARIRAARAFADLSQHELAAKLDQSVHTQRRTEQLKRPVTVDELIQIGKICGVPEWFMRHGFEISPAGHEALKRQDRLVKTIERGMRRIVEEASVRKPQAGNSRKHTKAGSKDTARRQPSSVST